MVEKSKFVRVLWHCAKRGGNKVQKGRGEKWPCGLAKVVAITKLRGHKVGVGENR